MPSPHRVRLHDEERGLPVGSQLREPYPKDPFAATHPGSLAAPLLDGQLLAQGQILGYKLQLLFGQGTDERDDHLDTALPPKWLS